MNVQPMLRAAVSLLLLIPFLLHASGMMRIGFVSQLEDLAYDARLNITLPEGVDERIVIVDIDERSLAEIGRWPWPRDRMATLVDRLFDDYEVNTVGFDIVFSERDADSAIEILTDLAEGPLAEYDTFREELERIRPEIDAESQFARALDGRNVVLGYFFRHSVSDDETDPRVGLLPAPLDEVDHEMAQLPLPRSPGYGANLPELQNAARDGGFFDNPLVSDDGVFRRVPLLQVHDEGVYPMFSLVVARAALDWPEIELRIESEGGGYTAIEGVRLGDLDIPVDGESGVLVPYRGPQGSFPYVPAHEVLHGTADHDILRDRIVLVGTSAAGLLDLRTTPVQNVFPGVEVHANIVAGILDGSIRERPAYLTGYEFALLAILGIAMTAAFPLLSPLWLSVSAAGLLAVMAGLNLAAWQGLGLVLPIASILFLIVLLYVFHMAWGYFIESRGKRQLARMFGHYVPPELVREMDNAQEEISLRGESRVMTVLFSDIRGFTSLSEELEPQELTRLMNAYLTEMTDVIHRHRGTIDKYIGDAIMAFWGAPLRDAQHARNALLAARGMIEVLDPLNQRFRDSGWPRIDIGIGLNTGEMNVGNMGSEFRMAYTVMGDSVNLASRLEGLTKTYGVRLLVTEFVREEVPEFEYREIDRVRVKGRHEPVTIHEPIDFVETIDRATRKDIRRHHAALKAYRAQDWDTAEREIFSLSRENPNDPLYPIYLDRIAHFRSSPPGPDWDGVFTHETK